MQGLATAQRQYDADDGERGGDYERRVAMTSYDDLPTYIQERIDKGWAGSTNIQEVLDAAMSILRRCERLAKEHGVKLPRSHDSEAVTVIDAWSEMDDAITEEVEKYVARD